MLCMKCAPLILLDKVMNVMSSVVARGKPCMGVNDMGKPGIDISIEVSMGVQIRRDCLACGKKVADRFTNSNIRVHVYKKS